MSDPVIYHADADPDDAFAVGDVDLADVDPAALDAVQAVVTAVNDPDDPLTAVEALHGLYGDDLVVP